MANEKLSDSAFIRTLILFRNEQKENMPPYMKVVDDCWEYVFDNLPISDVLRMSKTCKRLEDICGHYISTYYPATPFKFSKFDVITSFPRYVQVNKSFYKYITTLTIRHSDLKRWEKRRASFFRSVEYYHGLKTIKLISDSGGRIEKEIAKQPNILYGVKRLEFRSYHVPHNVFKQFSNYCPNLTSLCIEGTQKLNRIFHEHFPKLEYLRFDPDSDYEEEELLSFLNKHKNLEHIECNWRFFLCNSEKFEETIAKFNQITIRFTSYHRHKTNDLQLAAFFELLKRVYEKKLFKWLNFSFDLWGTDIHSKILINDKLIALGRVIPIKRLSFSNHCNEQAYDIAKKLIYLEEVRIEDPTIFSVAPFIQFALNLKSLRLGEGVLTFRKLNDVLRDLDLIEMNEVRKKNNARRMFIYMTEDEYFLAKEAISILNLSHIELKRAV